MITKLMTTQQIAFILKDLCTSGSLCFDEPSDQIDIAETFARGLRELGVNFDWDHFIEAATGLEKEDIEAFKEER